MKQSLAPLTAISEVRPEIYLIWLESPEIASAARPGQFVMVRCGEDDELLLRRPLSIHQVDEAKRRLALLFAVVGKGTRWLSRRKAGDSIDLFGPLGNGFSIKPDSKNLLLVAGDIGIAPLSFLAETAADLGCAVKLHQGVNEAGQVLLDALRSHYTLVPRSGMLAAAAQYASVGTIECTASTVSVSAWPTGLATVCIPGLAGWADQVFACGPVPMYKAMAQMKELKDKPVQVSLEMRMGCGLGVCYSCTLKTRSGLKQVCKDGPVFDLSDLAGINWDELIL
jgi:dihydroorotate dehydrogenase electron transfer subunit